MKLKFAFVLLAGIALLTNGSAITLARSANRDRVDKIKSNVQRRLQNGKTEVKVEKFDGTKIKGKITQADDIGFTFVESETNRSSVIAYSDTKKVKGTGWPTSAKIGIGVGVAAAATLVVLVVAFKNATRDN
ncbi:MAG: hypothetical protein PSX80_17155 [bacterium]|nr:hypothetical protein [bacterium]